MKTIVLSLLAAAGLAVSSAHADNVRFGIQFGTPAYAPGYYNYNQGGHWETVTQNVWVPPHWVSQVDEYGRAMNYYEPGHYEPRTRQVWVTGSYGYGGRSGWGQEWQERREHERWEHREHEEHEEREHRGWGDRGDRR